MENQTTKESTPIEDKEDQKAPKPALFDSKNINSKNIEGANQNGNLEKENKEADTIPKPTGTKKGKGKKGKNHKHQEIDINCFAKFQYNDLEAEKKLQEEEEKKSKREKRKTPEFDKYDEISIPFNFSDRRKNNGNDWGCKGIFTNKISIFK